MIASRDPQPLGRSSSTTDPLLMTMAQLGRLLTQTLIADGSFRYRSIARWPRVYVVITQNTLALLFLKLLNGRRRCATQDVGNGACAPPGGTFSILTGTVWYERLEFSSNWGSLACFGKYCWIRGLLLIPSWRRLCRGTDPVENVSVAVWIT
ncbi:hypothetical protein SCLCIDRAFT_1221623 [Scleroderma citrinum Foug A]|uniref:Uncharacterized protein n=1 Tax=Scleroderma citrinum Foug A TaxID=1036808 RepID=A0A0C3D1V2_9AGAM|nr:hypothetical protein SCLCIDRAFT_1221623 [Scleroderma citrinum Foug A]